MAIFIPLKFNIHGTNIPADDFIYFGRDMPMRQDRLLDYVSQERAIMGIIMWLVVGGVLGWLASVIMRTDGQQGIILNIVVGIIGAFISGLIFARGDINNAPLTITTFLVSLVGSIILLAIVNMVRRGSIR
jgi:uncharacterized membrane protein YeaQ/YmgE (transglycosylase-associated protein family)